MFFLLDTFRKSDSQHGIEDCRLTTFDCVPFARNFQVLHGVVRVTLNEVVGVSAIVFVEAVATVFQTVHACVGERKVNESVEGVPSHEAHFSRWERCRAYPVALNALSSLRCIFSAVALLCPFRSSQVLALTVEVTWSTVFLAKSWAPEGHQLVLTETAVASDVLVTLAVL